MAKWIGAMQEAENENLDMLVEEEAVHISKWKPVTLAVLLAGQKGSFVCVLTVDQQEADLMEALTEIEEDERPDDGAVEIDSDGKFVL